MRRAQTFLIFHIFIIVRIKAEFGVDFSAYDEDGDEMISFMELRKLTQSFGKTYSETELRFIIKLTDQNQNNGIERYEFLQMISKKKRVDDAEDELKEAFRLFDRSNDGFISISEMAMAGSMDEEGNDVIRDSDTDLDGKINYNEFVASFRLYDTKK